MIRLRHKIFLQFFQVFDLGILALTLLALAFYVKPDENAGVGDAIQTFASGSTNTFGNSPVSPFVSSIEKTLRIDLHHSDALAVTFLLLGWWKILALCVKYDSNRLVDLKVQARRTLTATILAALLVIIIGTLFGVGHIRRGVVIYFWVISSILLLAVRVALQTGLRRMRRKGQNSRHILILGDPLTASQLAEKIDAKPELGYHIEGLLAMNSTQNSEASSGKTRWNWLGSADNIKSILEKRVIDEIIISHSSSAQFPETLKTIKLGQQLGVVVRVIPSMAEFQPLADANLELFDGQYVLTFFREDLIWQLAAKRVMDIVISSILLLFLLIPLALVVVPWIKLTSPGPVFFHQERVGINRRRFKMHKFRSMYIDAEKRKNELAHLNEADGPVFKILNDPRITPCGRILRKTSIDELPQLWNVIKGDMSLVGPRPPVPSEVERYQFIDQRRLSIRPGITCLWQISGRSSLSFNQWMDLDRKYIENWSLWLDIVILFKTIPAVLLRRGAA